MGTPSSMPEGLQAARVRSGAAVLETEEGRLVGEVQLQPGGWYFTPYGYDRLFVALASWQRDLDVISARMEASQGEPKVRAPEVASHGPCSLLALLSLVAGLAAGYALARMLGRAAGPK